MDDLVWNGGGSGGGLPTGGGRMGGYGETGGGQWIENVYEGTMDGRTHGKGIAGTGATSGGDDGGDDPPLGDFPLPDDDRDPIV